MLLRRRNAGFDKRLWSGVVFVGMSFRNEYFAYWNVRFWFG